MIIATNSVDTQNCRFYTSKAGIHVQHIMLCARKVENIEFNNAGQHVRSESGLLPE